MKFSVCAFVLLFQYFTFSACNQQPERNIPVKTDSARHGNPSIRGFFSDQQFIRTDSSQLDSFFQKYRGLDKYDSDVFHLYAYRDFRYAWYNGNELQEQAGNLYNYLNNPGEEGIQMPVPYKAELDGLFAASDKEDKPVPELEILLTAEYLFYADKVWKGISEKNTTKLEWLLPRKKLNLPYITDSLLKDSSASLFDTRYNFRQYGLLQKELRKYKQLAATVAWNSLQINIKEIKKNDSLEVIGAIRRRLFLLGDLAIDSKEISYDESLEAGVKRFQKRNGLDADGRIGKGMLQALNTPLSESIRKIVINMERTRWVPIDLSRHYLVINIPAFSLYAYDQDTFSFQMNVVVGKDIHKTTIFSGDMKYIVFSPYWNVPSSILKSEILPAIRKNSNYLMKNNMEWHGNIVRQKPGPKNSLGLVKFLFPNSHDIYLHDSPAKSLFSATARAFSHGCIRLAEPQKLAEYLLKSDSNWTKEKIVAAMHAGKEKYVTLKNPVPVYIAYLTAWVGNNGELNFRKDIYNRDPALEEVMMK